MRSTLTTILGTATASGGSFLLSHYDRIASAALAIGGLAFLIWRWRKAARTQLCDKSSCPLRHTPAED